MAVRVQKLFLTEPVYNTKIIFCVQVTGFSLNLVFNVVGLFYFCKKTRLKNGQILLDHQINF